MHVASIASASPICAMSSSLSSTSSRHEIAAVPERSSGAWCGGACSHGAKEGWRTSGYDYDYDYDYCCCDFCGFCGCACDCCCCCCC